MMHLVDVHTGHVYPLLHGVPMHHEDTPPSDDAAPEEVEPDAIELVTRAEIDLLREQVHEMRARDADRERWHALLNRIVSAVESVCDRHAVAVQRMSEGASGILLAIAVVVLALAAGGFSVISFRWAGAILTAGQPP
jgi:hypothetical protein